MLPMETGLFDITNKKLGFLMLPVGTGFFDTANENWPF